MMIVRAPLRVSLFGGGADYPAFYNAEGGGAVVGFALDKYVYLSARRLPRYFDHRHRVVWSLVETVPSAERIQHPAVRAALVDNGWDGREEDGLELHHYADLPARAGLGSSSSFAVALNLVLDELRGLSPIGPSYLWRRAVRLERVMVGQVVGDQDQMFAAWGGFRFATFPLVAQPEAIGGPRIDALLSHLMLFFTGFQRDATLVAGKVVDAIEGRAAARASLLRMRDHAFEARSILTDDARTLGDIGLMLHETWLLKRGLTPGVSNGAIDRLYAVARSSGAVGGKLLGAGGGGFLLLYVEPRNHDRVRHAVRTMIPGIIEVPVGVARHGAEVVNDGRV